MPALPPERKALDKVWQYAAKLIMEGASAVEITKQVEYALFADHQLDLVQTAKVVGDLLREDR
jgi:hypothetical protein